MKKLLPYLILISALSVSGSAAFYSVYGLSKLFAGAAFQVMIMAGSLEVAKLVIATALHRYWKSMNRIMRTYLTISVILLIGITSAGIYGFLSSAYQVTAAKDAIVTKQINILNLKRDRFTEQKITYDLEKSQIINNISELRKSLSNPNQVQYVDRETGQLVTTTSSSARRTLTKQLDDATDRRDLISQKIENAVDSIGTMDVAIVEAQANADTTSELGPLKYISGLTGKSMDVVVNWFLFLLIFVFDPLAVTLIILANYSFERVYGGHANDVIEKLIDIGKKKDKGKVDGRFILSNDTRFGGEDRKRDSNAIPIHKESIQEKEEKVLPEEKLPVSEVVTPEPVTPEPVTPEPVTPEPEKIKRLILDDDVRKDVSEHIKEAMPWLKISDNEDAPVKTPELSDSQKRNMTHQEIEKWYKNNSIK